MKWYPILSRLCKLSLAIVPAASSCEMLHTASVVFFLLLAVLFIAAMIDSSTVYRRNYWDILIGFIGVFNGFFFESREHAIFWMAYMFFMLIDKKDNARK